MVENIKRKHIGTIPYIALIFSIIGIGIGTVAIILPANVPPQEENIITGMWSSVGYDTFRVPDSSIEYIPNLLINFTISEGEDAYFVFNGLIEFETPGLVQFAFWVDGQSYPQSFTNTEVPNLGGANFTASVSFFYTLYDFTSGNHNVTASVYSSSTASTLWFSRLLIQTFV